MAMASLPSTMTLTVEYDEPTRARCIAASVRQEVGEIDGDRSETTIERRGATVAVRIRAADLVALRAALNTWCTLLTVAERCSA